VASGVLAQAELGVELPWPIGERAGDVLAGEGEQTLVAVQQQRGRGKKGAVQADLLAAAKQHLQVGGHLLGAQRAVLDLDEPLQ
jgi:hypothetical protein